MLSLIFCLISSLSLVIITSASHCIYVSFQESALLARGVLFSGFLYFAAPTPSALQIALEVVSDNLEPVS